ncbi:10171_t:CDS:2 [Dentiscutata erythropus]|uniref:10171_t:CDS:1 n=1 Tax=Dentiscutata erythropus TaxID=1348616 RepID=A0A9N9GED1_9GLOM|nr:10171_t:CDS:2 [Dentiscutata erythropus]
MDNVMSKAIRERNDSDDRPIKKPDIFGTYSNGRYNWELLYREISNSTFVNTAQVNVHKKLDRIKLEKFAKTHGIIVTVSELFIVDRKYPPLYRLRRLSIVELPIQKNSSSSASIINLLIIKNNEDEEKYEENDKINFNLAPTSNTPRCSTNFKNKSNHE